MGRHWAVRLTLAALMLSLLVETPARAAVFADHVLYWNDVLLSTYRVVGGAPGPLARGGAMMHAAIYDGANSALCAASAAQCLGQPYLIKVPPSGSAVPDVATAVDYAAYEALKAAFPTRNFDTQLADAQSGISNTPERQAGQAMGTTAGRTMAANRSNDGSTNNTPYVPGTNPGDWRPTEGVPAATPNWGLVRPFAMTSGSQFRPAGPAGYSTTAALLASPEYAANVNEVKAKGRKTNSTRTTDETQTAWFWANDLDGTYKPPGQLFAHAQIVSKLYKLTPEANARLFALVAIAMADAGIASWDAKYLTPIDLWRPYHAIRLADQDGRGDTVPDTAWLPLSADRNEVSFSPPFPAYISGHATFAGAWASAMRGFFGIDNQFFTGTTEDPHAVGVTRSFASFTAAAAENARSRIFLGVHYQFDADSGVATGNSLANFVNANVARTVNGPYTFTGPSSYRILPCPGPFTMVFSLRDAAGNPVTDTGAVSGFIGSFASATVERATFNTSTGQFEIAARYNAKTAPATFSVLLRDGSRHTVGVECDAV